VTYNAARVSRGPFRCLVGLLCAAALTTLAACSGGTTPVAPTASSSLPGPLSGASVAGKVEVCHKTEGTNAYVLISVADPALETHIRHGDAQPGQPVPELPGFVFDASCLPVVSQGSPTHMGVLAGTDGLSGTIEITLGTSATATIAAAESRALASVLPASGTATFTGIGSIALSGTWDDTTGDLVLSGGGYTFMGTLSGNILAGTFSGPGGATGFFTALTIGAGTITTYCGTYSGTASGVWNFALQSTGQVLGAYAGPGGSGGVIGQATGSTLSGLWGNATEDGTYSGSCSGSSVSGTWAETGGLDSGTFAGSTPCP